MQVKIEAGAPAARQEGVLAVEKRRAFLVRAKPFLVAFAICATLGLFAALIAEIDPGAVIASAAKTPGWLFALSLGLSLVSYAALIGYDLCGLRAATEKRVPMRTVAFGSFTSYAIGHALGFPLLTAGAVRWRVYGRAGLSLAEVAKLTAVAGVTLWLGMAAVLGLGGVIAPHTIAAFDGLPAALNRSIGAALLLALAALVIWCGRRQRYFGRNEARVRLPGGWSALGQIGLGVVDVSAAAASLWVLMPPETGAAFPAFAVVFAAAIMFSVASHAPAGLGAFEVTMLLAFPHVPSEELLSALLVWRLTYTLIPFMVAAAMFGAYNANLHRPDSRVMRAMRKLLRVVSPVIPAFLALLTFMGGLVLLTSGALPADYSRIRALRHLVPLPFAEVSHLVGSAAGVVLLVLSRGLLRRLESAWTVTIVVMGAGMVVSLMKGFDWEEALILGSVVGLLLLFRSSFYRKAGLLSEPLEPFWLIAVALVIGFTIWLGFTAFEDLDYSRQAWWEFDWHDDASRFLRGSLAAVVVGAGLLLYAMIHGARAPHRTHPPLPDMLEKALTFADRADAQLAFLGDKQFLMHPAGDAFIMYAVRGRSWVAMGDPVGNPTRASELMWLFFEEVDRNDGLPVFYQVSPQCLPLYLDGGLSLTKLGEEAHVDLKAFSLDGRAGRDWRNALNRAARDGLSFAIIPAAEVPSHFAELKAVSDAWLAERGSREKGFSIGFWSESYLSRFDIAVVRREGRILAFANLWYGQKGGEITVDLMRRLPDMPAVMDLLFVSLMLHAKTGGYGWFNLGMAPLSGLSGHRLAPDWHKFAAFVARHSERFYGFHGLRAYKEKYHPVWEPRYLASPGGWALPQILLDVTTLVSAGPNGATTA
ncbi:bifunctional lysylphosphatidylglycerol flippase/synthetase MprF [Pseudochelatococcus lubricantis]|uniref:bifunctional lysylphosphatidylglycerol flippase/synthetase MprF n=1 Tax=Pseudochelatococcus lubricantis TaxID=1538102 RepID=UPI0035E483DD